ncbi:hypothetical protein M430DRAFT_222720 [Amorphotheca resinae ATCC 22711]|uniref:Uncharacterized protein n=1 Tax=Amorphotheca resinae ATCC 22711 TaxID=857342 RepID=A0A2T3B623_AMORE|nr:hypothetical protein M430DRAFT_222720 [Amorphotheca resinae ATCC 22711]PSS22215.1 hypothetical protein M430DRAFT_222720 [Amorphotheca resinae ATCC 22711]
MGHDDFSILFLLFLTSTSRHPVFSTLFILLFCLPLSPAICSRARSLTQLGCLCAAEDGTAMCAMLALPYPLDATI